MVLVTAALAGAAGCASSDTDDEGARTTGPATVAPPAPSGAAANTEARVVVLDGDADAPIAGVTVLGFGPGVQTSGVTDGAGRVTLAGDVRLVRTEQGRFGPARARVVDDTAELDLYDPDLQSPEYGGGPDRDRFVPDVAVGIPQGPPDWTFESRVLLEFPPAVSNGLLVVGTNSARVFAMDSDTGALRWARRMRGNIAASPAIADGVVYMPAMSGTLAAFRASDGKLLWEFSSGGSPIESSPLVVGGVVYVGAHNGVLYALDAETGEREWSYQAPGDIKGSAALSGDNIVVGDYAGQVHAVNRRTGAPVWRVPVGARIYGGPGVSGDTLVVSDIGGSVVALDAATGAERWRYSTGGAFVYASPAIAGDSVFLGAFDGRFRALDLATGAERWSADAGGRVGGSATVVGDVVYGSVLYRPGEPRRTFGLDTATGAVRYEGDDGRYSPAVAAGNMLFLIGTRKIYAYREPGA